MEYTLLATKLKIPPLTHHAVARARLSESIERGIPHYKLCLVSAPAGYGKTTLLTEWAHASRYPIAWLSLGADENDLERFLRYLFAAWEAIQPDIRDSELGLRLSAMSPDREATLTAFINIANKSPETTVFALDDYHHIKEDAVHHALAFLLDHLPPAFCFVVASRTDPPLPLARYRARTELLELGAEDLQFSPQETVAFLNQQMGLALAPDKIDALRQNLEGWIVGLHLAALHIRRDPQIASQLIGGRHRFIADYLSEDVLAPLPDNTQRFLLQTSILDRLCAALCEAVTGEADGQAMLERLERENLFLVPLDDRREWFRFHQLFGDFLRDELHRHHPEQVADLHHRAGSWYLDHDLPEPAFRHAIDGDDVELAVAIFDRYCNAKLNGGEIRVVEHWVNSIPEEWYAVYPMLGLARVGLLAFTGAFEACMRRLDEVEQRLRPAESQNQEWQLGRVIAVRCMLACVQNDLNQAEVYADQALQELPEDDLGWRPGIYNALGDTYRHYGRWAESKESYLKALSVTESPQIGFMSVHIFGGLADLALRQGHLRDADGYWRKALAVIQVPENWGRLPLPVSGWVHIRMGELLYEWNELAEAWDHLSDGLERAELGGDVRAMIAGYLIAGRLKLTEGDDEAAADYLERARPLVEQAQFSHWISRFERFQLELWLAQDRLRAAVDWSDQVLRDSAIEERPESEVAQLAMARVLIVKGDSPAVAQALSLLERLLEAAQHDGRMDVAIEGLALQALADWRRGERVGALTALERALRLAEPEGYVRLFADLGLPMARLLQEAGSRNVMPEYVGTLLEALSIDFESSTEAALPEPLTEREQEILQLVAAGLTNPEIAEKLVISPETVKKHAGNIYGKLGVSNRTEATVRARELDLLD